MMKSKSVVTALLAATLCALLTIGGADAKSKKKKAHGKNKKAVATAPATPQEAPAAPTVDADGDTLDLGTFDDLQADDKKCSQDITKLCPGVAQGSARLASCLRTNKSKLSAPCNKTLYKFLKQRFQSVCNDDVKKHCKAESTQKGGLMPCMQKKASDLSNGCQILLGLKKPPEAPAVPAQAPAAPAKK